MKPAQNKAVFLRYSNAAPSLASAFPFFAGAVSAARTRANASAPVFAAIMAATKLASPKPLANAVAARRMNLGCPVGALAGEIARGGKRTRTLLTEEMRTSLQLIADLIPSKDEGQARSRAILTYSALVGAIGLARAVSDEALSREILKSVSELLKKTVGDNG
jgi:hypothetical protein